jgi:hypothetical protein
MTTEENNTSNQENTTPSEPSILPAGTITETPPPGIKPTGKYYNPCPIYVPLPPAG